LRCGKWRSASRTGFYSAEDFVADGGASAAILTIAVTQLSALVGPGAPLTKLFDFQSRQFLPEK